MKEHEFRPEGLLQRYLELSARDAELCFAGVERAQIGCVACGHAEAEYQFAKHGFPYSRCVRCGTLYQNPRPPLAAFEAFYLGSESSRYWAEEFFPAVAEVRREKIVRPRVERLAALCAERGLDVRRLVEVGAGYGIFLDEWRRLRPGTAALAIEPSPHLAVECRRKGFDVVEAIAEHVIGRDGFGDLVACFEVLEHVFAPLEFVRVLVRLAAPGGMVCVSTLGVDGFDIQMLWERSNAIFPPHHINFLSIRGFEELFARAGLTQVDVLTPGQLDVDIVRNAVHKEPQLLEGHRFLRLVLSDERRASAFQAFLASARLSSHTWVIGKKPR